jgi:hypothetical protein
MYLYICIYIYIYIYTYIYIYIHHSGMGDKGGWEKSLYMPFIKNSTDAYTDTDYRGKLVRSKYTKKKGTTYIRIHAYICIYTCL